MWNFKDLTRRTAFEKFLRDKAFNIVKNPKYDEYQKTWFTNFLIKSPLQVVVLIIMRLNKICG